jgi:hypothetical protein
MLFSDIPIPIVFIIFISILVCVILCGKKNNIVFIEKFNNSQKYLNLDDSLNDTHESQQINNNNVNKIISSKYIPQLNEDINENIVPGHQLPWQNNPKNYGKMDILGDGMNGNAGFHFNLCSKSCCRPQYPTPFPLVVDSYVSNSKDEFVPTSYTCRNSFQDVGCLCLTKEQEKLLNNRGNNA